MERLDELSKSLAVAISRRESLRFIGVALAGVVLGPLTVRTAWAARPDRCVAFCRSCPTKKKRNQCQDACRACGGNTSRLCGSCGAYVCCRAETVCCNGTCTAVNSDPHNCGACGNVCAASAPICSQGTCSTSSNNCPPGTDFDWDNMNCGGCGIVCPPQTACSFGICEGLCIGCG